MSMNLQRKSSENRSPLLGDVTVLVLNSSQEMAKEMTMQLALSIPGCSIMYAPSLELARWMLRRRKINLIIASMLLPDGPVSRLGATLGELENPPDLVVVGNPKFGGKVFPAVSYALTKATPLNVAKPRIPQPTPQHRISNLSADLRNDLNNPLQEIVAMVFVARANGASSPVAEQALHAIDQAAQNLAKVVRGIEHKLSSALG